MTEERDFEKDLEDMMGPLMIEDDEVCKQVWSALANVTWYHGETNTQYGASFRSAGGLIADIIKDGIYLDWYMCADYAIVTEEIATRMAERGWTYKLE